MSENIITETMQNNQQSTTPIIKAKVQLEFIRFPRNYSTASLETFAILEVRLVELEDGNVALNQGEVFIVKGNVGELSYSETYNIIAKQVDDKKWGLQYDLLYFGTLINNQDVTKQKIFLQKILTEKQIESLYVTLPNPYETIEKKDKKSLMTVKGIGEHTANKMIENFYEHLLYADALVELNQFGLTVDRIKKLCNKYGSPTILVNKLHSNPYILADEVDGIGFKKADYYAMNIGIDRHSTMRIEAFIKYILHEEAMNGHSYLTSQQLMTHIIEYLGNDICRNTLRLVLVNLIDRNILWRGGTGEGLTIALNYYYQLEQNIAKELIRLKNNPIEAPIVDWKDRIKKKEEQQGWTHTEQQILAIETILNNQVVFVNGLAGCGKTSIIAGVLATMPNCSFALCALSGKASVRLGDATGYIEQSSTIHRLLNWTPDEGFTYHCEYPLLHDIIVVDEISMVGGELFHSLISAIRNGSKLIMLGDLGQLEAIGALNIAKDILESLTIPVVTLDKIHRQAEKSAIVTESLKVRNHMQITHAFINQPQEIRGELQDLTLHLFNESNEAMQEKMLNIFQQAIETYNILDTQLIVPLKTKGKICTFELNKLCQELYNPRNVNKVEYTLKHHKKEMVLREGDKVINVKNNYSTKKDGEFTITPVFNGNVGIIESIDLFNMVLIINFQTLGRIVIHREDWNNIELAYAISGHKSQGGQFTHVIVGLDFNAFVMLNKEWVYTAMTRAKEKLDFVCVNKALRYAIPRSNVSVKQTFLKQLLQKENQSNK